MIRILLPSRGRVSRLEKLIPQIVDELMDDVKFYVIQYDEDEPVKYKHHKQLHVVQSSAVGFWQVLNDWMVYSGRDYEPFIWLADDINPHKGWLDKGIAEWNRLFPEGLGLLVFNDLLARTATAAFAMTTPKWLYVLFGEPRFPADMPHNFVDTIVSDRSQDLKRYHFCEDIVIEHLHHSAGKSEIDDTYRNNQLISAGSKQIKDMMDRKWRSGGLEKAKERLASLQ
jgi:hypothetical protein